MTEKKKENEIIIIDAIMGTGKSLYLINDVINANPDRRYLIVVPTVEDTINEKTGERTYTSEATRYFESISVNGDVYLPQTRPTKTDTLRWAISSGKTIITSHSLILRIDEETMELLREAGYTLIIDECLSVVSDYCKLNIGDSKYRQQSDKRKRDDLKSAIIDKWVSINTDGILVWNDEKEEPFDNEYNGSYSAIRNLCKLNSLTCLKKEDGTFSDEIVVWNMPVKFFALFDTIYIATYLWNGSMQKAYFDMYDVQYTHMTLYNGQLYLFNPILESDMRQEKRNLINLFDGNLNKIGIPNSKRSNPLSLSWYTTRTKEVLSLLRNNCENYFKHYVDTHANENMYSTFKNYTGKIKGERYTKGFVPCSAKGTNEYRHKKSLAYLINLFPPQNIVLFFASKGVEINRDLYAISEMLQWIWRSAIRDGERINLYLPSQRMRDLLEQWAEGAI